MSASSSLSKGLKSGLFGSYSGKIGGMVIGKNGNIRIIKIKPKRKSKNNKL